MKALVGLLAAAAAVSACVDGYASKDEGLYLHFGMSETEAVSALNRIGEREYLPQAWRFDLKDGCQLQVTTLHRKLGKQVETVRLNQAEPEIYQAGTADSYTATLQTRGNEATSITVLSKATWSDVTMIRWLLNYLPKFCV